ncbi:MAG: 4-(cytidine 5'-diphospho)-2-C-methyl-D-erythritol kinase [Defluviitaleaceae bacterium]|nr:4-(cytidine 5'-diphospho)-2-C-methyl-D-erythritol kinase [Defluviitaleaceae bacterium]
MMQPKHFVTLKANAKINLALSVLGKREDGYHDLEMVAQTLLLHDNIFMKKVDYPEPKITITSNVHWLPTGKKNLVYQAIALMQKKYSLPGGVYVDITKNIPVAAGLGGGSADCATALLGIRRLYNINVSSKELQVIGKTLGADVPFMIAQGTVLAEGIGERLTRLPPHPSVYVLLAKPHFSVSTSVVFQRLEKYPLQNNKAKLNNIIRAISRKDPQGIAKNFFNDLEVVTAGHYPVIDQVKESILQNGAMGALMSGSGPTVFGYFRTKKQAIFAAKALRRYGVRETYLTGIYNKFI